MQKTNKRKYTIKVLYNNTYGVAISCKGLQACFMSQLVNQRGTNMPSIQEVLINSFMTEVLSYRNQSSDLLCKSMDWFHYDNGAHHERVNTSKGMIIYCKILHHCKGLKGVLKHLQTFICQKYMHVRNICILEVRNICMVFQKHKTTKSGL